MEKDSGDLLRKQKEHRRDKKSPAPQDPERDIVSLPDPVPLPGTVVLGSERVDGSREPVGNVPGDGLDLISHAEHRQGKIAVSGGELRQHKGNPRVDHVLDRSRQSDADDVGIHGRFFRMQAQSRTQMARTQVRGFCRAIASDSEHIARSGR